MMISCSSFSFSRISKVVFTVVVVVLPMAMIMVGGPWCTYFAYCRRWWYGTAQYGTVGDLRFKEIVIIDMCRLSTKKNDYFRVPVVRVI